MLWIATTREVGIRPRPLPLVVSQCVGFVLRGMALTLTSKLALR